LNTDHTDAEKKNDSEDENYSDDYYPETSDNQEKKSSKE
jgi:hypothetical protein